MSTGPSEPPGSGRRPRWRRAAIALLVVVATLVAWCGITVYGDGDEIRERVGSIIDVDSVEIPGDGPGRGFRMRLESDAGTRVSLRLRVPRSGPTPRQLVVLIDGQGVGADAIELLPEDRGTVAAALDYPESFPMTLEPLEAILGSARLRDAALRVPASVLLAVEHLSGRPDVDSSRIAIIGSSLGVPSATIAAALDRRVDGVALVYGGGDLGALLDANLAIESDPARWLASRYGAWLLGPLEPARYAGRIAPRPFVMVNGRGDTRIPRRSVLALYRSARPPRELVWLPTGHLQPWDTALIRTLVDTAIAKLPTLRRTPP